MKKLVFLLLSVFFTITSFAQENTTAFEMNERLGRGINMGNAFEAPTETAWSNPWKAEYFEIMAELGFTHVRVPIRWEPAARSMANSPYTITPSFLNRIKDVVDEALKNKLHIIINMHHHEALIENPDGQKERFLSMWSQIATFFQDYPDSLLFEILNEPNGKLTTAKWNEFLADALDTIRVTNPDRFVLIGTADWGGLSGLSQLELPDDDNIILTLHYYSPFNFTHQGAEWVENSNPWLGTKWQDTEAERESIRNDFQYALSFAETNQVPIHIGEFGAYSKADIESRSKWTTFLARWFEEQGFSWAYWEFSAGFGIYNPNTRQLNNSLVNALLHNLMPEPIGIITTPVYHSNFSATNDGWTLQRNNPAVASLSRVDGKLVATISVAGTAAWHIQLMRSNLSLKGGSTYRVSFTASAEAQRSATVYVGRTSSPWDSYSGYTSITLTPEELNYSFTFNMITDATARIVFDLGTSAADFTLYNLKVDEVAIPTSASVAQSSPVAYYPNPVKQIMTLNFVDAYSSLHITDMTGRQLLAKTINSSPAGVDLSIIPQGLYVVTLRGTDQTKSFTILKE